MSELFVPVIVITEGDNPNFRSYMNCKEVEEMQKNGGAGDKIYLRETEDRPVPECLKNGTALIKDVWVTLVTGPSFNG